MNPLVILYTLSLLLCAVSATIWYPALRSRGLGLFAPLLWYGFIQESAIRTMLLLGMNDFNSGLAYHLYSIICVCFYAQLYYRVDFYKPFRRWIWVILSVFAISTSFIFLFVTPITKFNFSVMVLAGTAITIFALIFLYLYFNLDNRKLEKAWMPMIYITVALCAFFPVTNIVFIFQDYLRIRSALLFGMKLYHIVPQVMSILMYSLFSYAFYLCNRKN